MRVFGRGLILAGLLCASAPSVVGAAPISRCVRSPYRLREYRSARDDVSMPPRTWSLFSPRPADSAEHGARYHLRVRHRRAPLFAVHDRHADSNFSCSAPPLRDDRLRLRCSACSTLTTQIAPVATSIPADSLEFAGAFGVNDQIGLRISTTSSQLRARRRHLPDLARAARHRVLARPTDSTAARSRRCAVRLRRSQSAAGGAWLVHASTSS